MTELLHSSQPKPSRWHSSALNRESPKPHVVVVGMGFGGTTLVKQLRQKHRRELSVTVIDRHNHQQFTPFLYQLATASLAPTEIATPIRAFSARRDVQFLMAEVSDIDLSKRQLRTSDGHALGYDYLVVATGARPHFFGNEAWKSHFHTLSSVESALRLREHILTCLETAELESDPLIRRELLTFVIVGAGPTGVELAGALCDLLKRVVPKDYTSFEANDVRVVLLEATDRVLPTFERCSSERALRDLRALGVEVHTGTKVEGVADGVAETTEGTFRAQTLCWGAGVAPGAITRTLSSEHHRGRIVVRDDCSLEQDQRVFVIGDAAYFVPEGASDALPAVAPVAIQQAKHVARCVTADLEERRRPTFSYRNRGKMATIGRGKAVVELGSRRFAGVAAWGAWLLLHVRYLMGLRNQILVLFEWTWAFLRRGRGPQVILGLDHSPARKE